MCFCGARALCALGEKVLQSSCTVNMLGNPLADPFVDVCVYIVCVCWCMHVSVCLLAFASSQLAYGRSARSTSIQVSTHTQHDVLKW